jgi:hypothetical protein
MAWTRDRILQTLKQLHAKGSNLSYNAMQKKHQPLLSAAAYHFGSYRTAIDRAGIDYAEVLRRPRWSKAAIIKVIKNARKKGQDLHWSAVTKRRDELGKAAFASLQKRLFGKWDRALSASGLDADDVNRYRKWDRNTIAAELKEMHRDGESLSSGAMQKNDPGLHAAAVRYFGRYDEALKAAGVDPDSVRQRQSWTRASVLKAIKQSARTGVTSDTAIRKVSPALYGAAVRLFGTYVAARKSAGVAKKKR